MLQGWKGLWIEGNTKLVKKATELFKNFLQNKIVKIENILVTEDNIASICKKQQVPLAFDLLSIDIDGNDYWIWQKINTYQPRVVVLEYNGSFGSTIEWVKPYEAAYIWDNSVYGQASLKAYQVLGEKMGYKLVGCNYSGVNSFFVREDLVKDKFLAPFTSENHFEKPRGDLLYIPGLKRDKRVFEASFDLLYGKNKKSKKI